MDSHSKTFLLGLGAQKAGTSWLHNYVNSDTSADFGPLKEYHVWDAMEMPDMSHFDVRPASPLNRAMQAAKGRITGLPPEAWRLRGAMQALPETYFGYFESLLSKPGIALTGDITPSYAGLSEATLRQIRQGFETRGIMVKTIFVMRDPATRAISAVRMNRRKRNWREGVPLTGKFDAAVLAYAASRAHALRADYGASIDRIKAVFDPAQIRFAFYETLFEPDTLRSLSDFLGVSFRPDLAEKRVYGSEGGAAIDAGTLSALRDRLAGTYEYCAQHFPETRQLWQP